MSLVHMNGVDPEELQRMQHVYMLRISDSTYNRREPNYWGEIS